MMDLSKMSRSDLTALQSRLNVIGVASEYLAQGGLEPLISLTGDASVITVEPILSYGPVADVVLIENASIEIAPGVASVIASPMPDAAPAEMRSAAAEHTVPLPAIARMKEEFRKAAVTPAAPTLAAVGDGRVTGPMSDEEKRTIAEMRSQGLGSTDIAARLKRKPQVIAMYLMRLPQGAGQVPAQAKEAAQAAVSAEIQMPGGDREGLQQQHAEHDPVQSGAVDGQQSVATPDEARLSFTGESKRIWDHVQSLGFPKGWDANLDLEMSEAFGRGTKADQVALDLDCDTKLLRDRYAQLTACIRDDRGRMSIDGQERLVRVLQARLKNLRAAKAA